MRGPKLALLIVAGVLGALVLVGLIAYASDYGAEGTVTRKDCRATAPFVQVHTKMFGLDRTSALSATQCAVVQVGNFVVYHIRTGRTTIYDHEGGECVYDSVRGLC